MVLILAQVTKCHTNFEHFNYSLLMNKKNILGEYSLFFKYVALFTTRLNKLVLKRLSGCLLEVVAFKNHTTRTGSLLRRGLGTS